MTVFKIIGRLYGNGILVYLPRISSTAIYNVGINSLICSWNEIIIREITLTDTLLIEWSIQRPDIH